MLKIDVESSEWPFLQDVTSAEGPSVLRNVKQLAIEIHTPRFTSENRAMSVEDYAQIIQHFTLLSNKLGFKNYYYRHDNNCCGTFTPLTDRAVTGSHLCCYEIYQINSAFI